MWMMPAHSAWYLNYQIIFHFADFIIQSHTQFFFQFSDFDWGSLGFRSEKLQTCSIRSCLFWVLCRIIWIVVIACSPFNCKLIYDFEGLFLMSNQLSISMPIDQCIYRHFIVNNSRAFHTLASVSVTKLLTAHRYCAFTPLFHFQISTFGLH